MKLVHHVKQKLIPEMRRGILKRVISDFHRRGGGWTSVTSEERVLLGRFALVAQRSIVVKLYRERSVGRSVCLSVCPVHCGKTADQIRIPFDIIGWTGPGMRQVVGFGYRSTGRGIVGGEFGAHHCNQSVRVRQCRNATLFPNYFGQTCCQFEER